jgi:CBS domain-containing protein
MALAVEDLMERRLFTIVEEMSVAEASRLLRERSVSGAPVVDRRGRPVGVISRTDLIEGWERAAVEARKAYYCAGAGELLPPISEPPADFGAKPVRDAMMPLVFSVQASDPVQKAAQLMAAEGIHRVIVLAGERLVGLLSASDIVRAVAQQLLVARA